MADSRLLPLGCHPAGTAFALPTPPSSALGGAASGVVSPTRRRGKAALGGHRVRHGSVVDEWAPQALTFTALAAALHRTRHGAFRPSCSARQVALKAVATEAAVEAGGAAAPALDDSGHREGAPLLSAEWEDVLRGRTGDIWSEPDLFKTLVQGGYADSAGDESCGSLRFERISSVSSSEGKDLLLFVPGIDFTGIFAASQYRELARDYELWRCYVGSEDRTPFVRLVDNVQAWLEQHLQQRRRVVVAGESFGGLVALAVALRLGKAIHGLVLVNPATSFNRSIWPLLGRAMAALPERAGDSGGAGEDPWAGLSSTATTEELFEECQKQALQNPYAYLGSSGLVGSVTDSNQLGRILSLVARTTVDEQVRKAAGLEPQPVPASLRDFLSYPLDIARLLPPNTVRFRLRAWLRDGCEAVEAELRARGARATPLPSTLLVCGEQDQFIPSRSEAERLMPILKFRSGGRAELLELPAGHAPLDVRVDLATVIRKSPVGVPPEAPKDYVASYVPPSLEEVEKGARNIEGLCQVFSPVFISRGGPGGSRSYGLSGVPDPEELGGRPLLLVGNHQLIALDLGPLVLEFLVEKGWAPRGMAHPINFPETFANTLRKAPPLPQDGALEALGLPFELKAAIRASLEAAQSLLEEEEEAPKEDGGSPFAPGAVPGGGIEQESLGVGENFGVGGSFARWGAVPVTPRTFFRLLQRGDPVLLFPGGAREACHGAGEKYQLFWPKRTDFIRAAAKFNAVIVPFGSVGSADSFTFLPEDWGALEPLKSALPMFQGAQGAEQLDAKAWGAGGLSAVSEALEAAPVFPSLGPQTSFAQQAKSGFADRFYYSFGEPVDLAGLNPKDREACAEVYGQLKGAVEGEMTWLLENRVKDTYRDFLRRQIYEQAANAGGKVPRQVKAGPNKGGVVRGCARRAPSTILRKE